MNITFVSAFLSALLASSVPTASIVSQTPPPPPPPVVEGESYEVMRSYIGEVTAYTSREEETDDTPHISASGHTVHWGMVATNAYPFGTKIRFPELYGDKIFVVKDRMNQRYQNRIDIWFPEYERAVHFGLKKARVEIVRDRRQQDIALR
ncbi:MAG: 3D domain-containing protein [Candidatus Ryanbacteria bacterium]|nr:3D domain-containing protein [Candidatus Ryanbacteria bacterium]